MHLSVVTATWRRPKDLFHCLTRFVEQVHELQVEHVVVSDGPDGEARTVCGEFPHARYLELDDHSGKFGARALDLGMRHVSGEYVCFWDDDNWYAPHALATLYAAASGADVGVVQIRHRQLGFRTIPQPWTGEFQYGNVDLACFCVRTPLARRFPWEHGDLRGGHDFPWIKRVRCDADVVRFVPTVIGVHL